MLGNHDAAVFSVPERAFFNPNAREALSWTTAQLSEDDITYLQSLPYRVSTDNLLFVHSAPRITSYNVCYTKLLRIPASGGRFTVVAGSDRTGRLLRTADLLCRDTTFVLTFASQELNCGGDISDTLRMSDVCSYNFV